MGNLKSNDEFLEWLANVMLFRPKGNYYLDSDRGLEVAKLCLDFERDNHSWRRSDEATFWIDVQLFTKYKLENSEIEFIMKMQGGIKNWHENSEERKAYAEFMRGLKKLIELNSQAEAK